MITAHELELGHGKQAYFKPMKVLFLFYFIIIHSIFFFFFFFFFLKKKAVLLGDPKYNPRARAENLEYCPSVRNQVFYILF